MAHHHHHHHQQQNAGAGYGNNNSSSSNNSSSLLGAYLTSTSQSSSYPGNNQFNQQQQHQLYQLMMLNQHQQQHPLQQQHHQHRMHHSHTLSASSSLGSSSSMDNSFEINAPPSLDMDSKNIFNNNPLLASSPSSAPPPPPPLASTSSSSSNQASSAEISSKPKIVQACDACNRKKVKCDNLKPSCTNCTKSRLVCEFSRKPKKRGPRAGYVEALESRVREMEKALKIANIMPPSSPDMGQPVPLNSSFNPAVKPSYVANMAGMSTLSMNVWGHMDKDLPSTTMRPLPENVDVSVDELRLAMERELLLVERRRQSIISSARSPSIGHQRSVSMSSSMADAASPAASNLLSPNMARNTSFPHTARDRASSEEPGSLLQDAPPLFQNDGSMEFSGSIAESMGGVSSTEVMQQLFAQTGFRLAFSDLTSAAADPLSAAIDEGLHSFRTPSFTGQAEDYLSAAVKGEPYDNPSLTPPPSHIPRLSSSPSNAKLFQKSNSRSPTSSSPIETLFSLAPELLWSPTDNSSAPGPADTSFFTDTSPHPCPPLPPISHDLVRNMVNIYFDFVYPWVPVFHREIFVTDLEKGAVPKLLVLTVCALAARYSPLEMRRRSRRKTWEALSAGKEEEDPGYKTLGDMFYIKAREILSQYLDIPSEETVASLGHLAAYAAGCGRGSAAWMYAGMATRMGLEIKLNLEVDPSAGLSPFVKERRRRLWWLLFILDRIAGAASEMAMIINDKDCQVYLPSNNGWDYDPNAEAPQQAGFVTLEPQSPKAPPLVRIDSPPENDNLQIAIMSAEGDFVPPIPPQNHIGYSIILFKIFGRVVQHAHRFPWTTFMSPPATMPNTTVAGVFNLSDTVTHFNSSAMPSSVTSPTVLPSPMLSGGPSTANSSMVAAADYQLSVLSSSLHSFFTNLADWLKELGDTFSDDVTSRVPQSWYVPYMHIQYYVTIITLHRPRMIAAIRTAAVSITAQAEKVSTSAANVDMKSPPAESPFLVALKNPSVVACRQAAISVSKVIEKVRRTNPNMHRLIPFVAFGTFQGGLIHVVLCQLLVAIVTASQEPLQGSTHARAVTLDDIVQTVEYTRMHVKALESMADEWFVIGRLAQVLKGVVINAEEACIKSLSSFASPRNSPAAESVGQYNWVGLDGHNLASVMSGQPTKRESHVPNNQQQSSSGPSIMELLQAFKTNSMGGAHHNPSSMNDGTNILSSVPHNSGLANGITSSNVRTTVPIPPPSVLQPTGTAGYKQPPDILAAMSTTFQMETAMGIEFGLGGFGDEVGAEALTGLLSSASGNFSGGASRFASNKAPTLSVPHVNSSSSTTATPAKSAEELFLGALLGSGPTEPIGEEFWINNGFVL